MEIRRFEVYLVSLDPTTGHEIKKTRPCVVISPDEMNKHIKTVIIAPMTTKRCAYITRIPITFDSKEGEIVLDQIRTVDKSRLVEYLGKVDESIAKEMTKILLEMFAE
ncbi:PEMK-like protein [Thioploca ingrica]|uniref:mRNA interferase n=1 Tax=Thioploca ingrica TaxID=40754 RepID=A0A090ANG5_9GAMM|nr:PEMK-like protein [Thioploca ingrica]